MNYPVRSRAVIDIFFFVRTAAAMAEVTDQEGRELFACDLVRIGGLNSAHFVETYASPLPQAKGWMMVYQGGADYWFQDPATIVVGAINDLFIADNTVQTASATGVHAISIGNITTNGSNSGFTAGAGAQTNVPADAQHSGIVNIGGLVSGDASDKMAGSIVMGNNQFGVAQAQLAVGTNLNTNAQNNILFGPNTRLSDLRGVPDLANLQTMANNFLAGNTQLGLTSAATLLGAFNTKSNFMWGDERVSFTAVGLPSNASWADNISIVPNDGTPFSSPATNGLRARTALIGYGCRILGDQTGALANGDSGGYGSGCIIGTAGVATAVRSWAFGYAAIVTNTFAHLLGTATLNDTYSTALGVQDSAGGPKLAVAYPGPTTINNPVQTTSNSTDVGPPNTSAATTTCGKWTTWAALPNAPLAGYKVYNTRLTANSVVRVSVFGGVGGVITQGTNIEITVTQVVPGPTGYFVVTLDVITSATGFPVTFFYEILYPSS